MNENKIFSENKLISSIKKESKTYSDFGKKIQKTTNINNVDKSLNDKLEKAKKQINNLGWLEKSEENTNNFNLDGRIKSMLSKYDKTKLLSQFDKMSSQKNNILYNQFI